ncbi:hypothetical protein SLEP1_g60046 [Rubroshorea leprosula]|uniref:Uncharacterized protein n=1 Tax=Rubroshorea leprosula TaxID=152421 RepID=A0AAV5MVH6_9ROSI|nr:hypothetical protein SLEP1_g60046 [Rubroshorea leprosula]
MGLSPALAQPNIQVAPNVRSYAISPSQWNLHARLGVDDAFTRRLPMEPIPSNLSARLIPVHSPLLGKSLLLSFPPLNNMLKFSGVCTIQGSTGFVQAQVQLSSLVASLLSVVLRVGVLSAIIGLIRGNIVRLLPSTTIPRHRDLSQARMVIVLTDPHTGKALVIANQSRNMRSNIRRSVNSAVRAAYRSLAAFFIDLRPK